MPLRFLIADDNAAHQRLVATVVTALGGESVSASNGHEVVSRLEREFFDVILLDMWMPQMGGARTASHLLDRFNGAPSRPRIVAVTGDSSEGRRALCRVVGMDGFIAKPCGDLRHPLKDVLMRGHCWLEGPTQRLLDLECFWESLRHGEQGAIEEFERAVEAARGHFRSLFVTEGDVSPHAEALEIFARKHGFIRLRQTMDSLADAARCGETLLFFAQVCEEGADFEQTVAAARESLRDARADERLRA